LDQGQGSNVRNPVHTTVRKMRIDLIKGTFVVFIVVSFFVFFLLLAFCTEVSSESKAPGVNNGQCIPIPKMIDIIKNRFKETVVFKGTNNRGEMVLISHNPLTKSWSAINQYQGQFFCLVAFGSDGLVMPELEDDGNSEPKSN